MRSAAQRSAGRWLGALTTLVIWMGIALAPARAVPHVSAGTHSGDFGARAAIADADTAPLVHRVAVFGTDDRTQIPPKYLPLKRKIGLLYNEQAKTVCSAFCVGPSLVATAAHCLFRTLGDKAPNLADFVFTPTYSDLKEASRIAGYSAHTMGPNVISGSTQIRVRPPIDAASDWALVRLANPVCKGGHLPVLVMNPEEIQKAANEKKLFQLSYHRDYPNWQLAYSKPCEAAQTFGQLSWSTIARDFSSPQSLILHRCDTGGASSGSPILLDEPGGPFVVGINVGTYVLSKVLMRQGKVAKRFKQDIIANTAVNAGAFASLVQPLTKAQILATPDRVLHLQQLLKDLHHYNGPLDSAYGIQLKSAIQDFEKTHGLPVTGLATEQLLVLIGTTAGGLNKPTSHEGRAPKAQ